MSFKMTFENKGEITFVYSVIGSVFSFFSKICKSANAADLTIFIFKDSLYLNINYWQNGMRLF